MRKRIDELNQIPPDYPDISAQEFAALPDEFNRDTPVRKQEKKKPSVIRKVMLYLASIGVVTVGIITPVIRVNPPETSTVAEAPQPSAASSAAPRFTPAATVRPTEAPTSETNETPTPGPDLTGQIHITVYSDIFDWYSAMYLTYPSQVLADDTLDAATFTAYKLPPLPEQKGYTAIGYVLARYSSRTYLDELLEDAEKPHVIGSVTLGDTLTAQDLGIVPKSVEDIYQVEVHVVWVANEPNDHNLQFYDGDKLFHNAYIWFPIYYDELCYLAPFPKPTRPGKTFAGWCDADGHMVDAVTFYDFYEKLDNAETLKDRDWEQPIPCRVYACWSDGSGGAPQPTPKPTPTPTPVPTPRPIYYQVTVERPLGFSEGDANGGTRWVEKNGYITVYMKMVDYTDYYECNVFAYGSSGTEEHYNAEPYKTIRHDTDTDDYYEIFFRFRIKVTENIRVVFMD